MQQQPPGWGPPQGYGPPGYPPQGYPPPGYPPPTPPRKKTPVALIAVGALVHGPRAPMEILAGGMTVIASTWATCPEAHRRDGGRYYEKGEAHECPARDCAMGRVFGWDWTEPVRWVFCEGIGEQGRSVWVPTPNTTSEKVDGLIARSGSPDLP